MKVEIENLVSMTEANQNFSKVARLVDKSGVAVVLKNNSPKYIILDYSQINEQDYVEIAEVKKIGKSIIERNINAFRELAK